MGTPHEHPNKKRIRQAAFVLMYEQGTKQTSYTAIAQKAGVGRPLVQRHYPKKDELLVLFITQVVDTCKARLADFDQRTTNPVLRTLHLSQLYLQTVLYDENMQALTLEILSNRDITGAMVRQHFESSFVWIAQQDNDDQREAYTASIKAIGGIDELLVIQLKDGVGPDAGDLAAQLMAGIETFVTNAAYRDTYLSMLDQLMDVSVAKRLAADVLREVLVPEVAEG